MLRPSGAPPKEPLHPCIPLPLPSILTTHSTVTVSGQAGTGKSNLLLSSSAHTLLNSDPPTSAVVYLSCGMENNAGVEARLRDILASVVGEADGGMLVQSALSRFYKVTVRSSEDFEELMGMPPSKALRSNADSSGGGGGKRDRSGAPRAPSPRAGTVKLASLLSTIEKKGQTLSLACLDSVAGLYRSGFSDRQQDEIVAPVLAMVACKLRELKVCVLVSNQVTGDSHSECFGDKWRRCCQGSIKLSRWGGQGDGGKFKRTWKGEGFAGIKDWGGGFVIGRGMEVEKKKVEGEAGGGSGGGRGSEGGQAQARVEVREEGRVEGQGGG